MSDAEYAAQKARVKAILDAWRIDLGLGPWRLKINYERRRATQNSGEDWESVSFADVCVDWRYAQAVFYVYLESCAALDDEELEERLVHEFCHCLVAELRDTETGPHAEYLAHEEHVATTLARAFVTVRERARATTEETDGEGQVDGARGDAEQALRGAEATNDRQGGVRLGQHEGGQGDHERRQGEEQEALRERP